MTWRTQEGVRVLAGAEAALYREMMGMMSDLIMAEIEGNGPAPSTGVALFDRLDPLVRLSLLAEVSWALLRETDSPPPLRAVNEAVIGALFRQLDDSVQLELGCGDDDDPDGSAFWRSLILAAFHELGDTDELPNLQCPDPEEWDILIEVLTDRILWDWDFDDEELYLDKSPEHVEYLKNVMAIDPEYFTAIPPDPKPSDISRLRSTLRELYGQRSIELNSGGTMQQETLGLVAEVTADELRAAGWVPKTAQFPVNDVVFLPASKDKISFLFQFNVRPSGQPRVQPSVGMHREPAMKRNNCVGFIPADILMHEDGTITSDGLASIKKAISDADAMLENRKRFNAKYAPKS